MISANGRYVAFASYATNLAPTDTDRATDIFVHDLQTGSTIQVNIGLNLPPYAWASSPSISADGRKIAYAQSVQGTDPSCYTTMEVYLRDLDAGTTTRVSTPLTGTLCTVDAAWPAISSDGRYVVYNTADGNLVPGDTNSTNDIFLYDIQAATTQCVSTSGDGTLGNGAALTGSISGDGHYVVFASWASNLVVGDSNGEVDTFVKDLRSP